MVTITVKVPDALWERLEGWSSQEGLTPEEVVTYDLREAFGIHAGSSEAQQVIIDIKKEL